MKLGGVFGFGTGTAAVLPKLQQLADLGHAETQLARTAQETQRLHLFLALAPVARLGRATAGSSPSDSQCLTILAETPERDAASPMLNCSALFIGALPSSAAATTRC